ncbi:MAG TPA: hypothetical protein PKE37_15905 [Thiomonas arsenitoxydans]|uniref:recombinase-like helix-turn-helix domain-containing protein n=1 Tax=Thiomonas arsenitoxydans (strain DSM 22701 / CIP 110005 / 3As) TaxID=426114 RepID=UPI002CBBFCE6|nr:recombinase-like helix-turn-helix domain-containing protein [Thiomonas arsenitoxydans]HML83238.1 hypothetical protein [Thiomonas arsenitoxydans]
MAEMSEHLFNPHLMAWRRDRPSDTPNSGEIEEVDAVRNIVWQTRGEEPSAFERDLADTLINVFGSGVTSLPEVVAGLDAAGLRQQNGARWTQESFRACMARLAR